MFRSSERWITVQPNATAGNRYVLDNRSRVKSIRRAYRRARKAGCPAHHARLLVWETMFAMDLSEFTWVSHSEADAARAARQAVTA